MARAPVEPWREPLRLSELDRGPVRRRLAPDDAARAALGRSLNLGALESLTADLTVSPWLDGAEIAGRFDARVVQTCGITLEPFETQLSGDISLRVLPAGSPNLPANDEGEEIDLDAPDPPDEVQGESVDLAAIVIEHLALEIDPFPRKPGAVFESPAPTEEASPFAVLKRLKPDNPAQ